QPNLTSGSFHYLAPDDLATIYYMGQLYAAGIDGTGQKIAVIGRTDIDLADLRAFRTRFGLPPNDPQVVLYGPAPGISPNDLVEADLDLEWAGAVARNATVIYVNSRSVNTSAQYAVDQNLAPVLTMSYGACEITGSDTLRSVAQQASAQGITWAIASGDSGAATCDRSSPTPQAAKGATVSYPASIPEVTAVGGTQFDDEAGQWWSAGNSSSRASALSYIPEKVWNQSIANNAIEGGGGGASALFVKPAWQIGPGVPNDGRRNLPDVSFASATHDGYEIVSGGLVWIIGGTSAASPVFAGVVALLNHSLAKADPTTPAGLGNINPALYRLAQSTTDVFHDITVGDNSVACVQGSPDCVDGRVGYPATPGYDLATGLGSLDVAHFVKEWNTGTSSTTSVSATPASFAPGDRVELTAMVSGAAGIPGGAVTFVANDIVLGSAILTPVAGASSAAITVDGMLLAGGNGTVGALYGGDATFTGSAGYAVLSLRLPASGSLLIPSINPNPVAQSGTAWPYTLRLSEKAGVATKITVFTVDNVNNLGALSDPNIPANGTVFLSLAGSGLTPPRNRVFHFEGLDSGGAPWQRDLTVPFVGPQGPHITPAISLSLSPDTVRQNPGADPACQWSQQVTVQETTGFHVSLSSFSAGGVSMTSRLSQLFGTTRLAPYGMLTATICFTGITPPQQRGYSLTGTTEAGSVVSAAATGSFAGPAPVPAAFSVSRPEILITGNGATLDLTFAGGAPEWTASVLPASRKWLTVSTPAGVGSATLNLSASAAGLSKGVYNAVLSLQASDALPQTIQVPVVFVVGPADGISITGVGNAASGAQAFAPGQLLAVYGTNLAPAVGSAALQPLPLTLAGVSATVNGISAPLWFVSPGQINLQIPYEVSAGPAVLGVSNNGRTAAFMFRISPAAPGIFAFQGALVPSSGARPGQTIVGFLTGDGDVTPTLASGATLAAGPVLSQYPQS
ncbi:MAG: Ig-like domain repeat protein, partial [Acidobacteriota bacterium]